jgi:hypothetical protein
MMDGMPMIDLADYVTKKTYNYAECKSSEQHNVENSSGSVENIFKNCVGSMLSGDSKVDSLLKKGKAAILFFMMD